MKRLAFGALVLIAFAVIVGAPSKTSRPAAAGLPKPSALMKRLVVDHGPARGVDHDRPTGAPFCRDCGSR